MAGGKGGDSFVGLTGGPGGNGPDGEEGQTGSSGRGLNGVIEAGGGGGGGAGSGNFDGGNGGAGGAGSKLFQSKAGSAGGAGGTAASPDGKIGGESDGSQGAGGGGGGYSALNGDQISNVANLKGGNGGAGGAATAAGEDGGGGGGGEGGYGAVVSNNGLSSNSGSLSGGDGGNGGNSAGAVGGDGGDGGIGVLFTTAGASLINSGLITGGDGGAGGSSFPGGFGLSAKPPGHAGLGGAGVVGAALTVINTGTITGGMSGATTPVQADAITFTGGSNSLALGAQAAFTGAINVKAGTLTFDQSKGSNLPADAALSTSIIGAGSVTKVGTGTLTLSGANTYSGGTEIRQGTLAVSADNNLGDAAGGVTLFRGTLEATSSFTSARAVTLLGGGGAPDVIAVDANVTLNLTGVVTASAQDGGPLLKQGFGNLVLSGSASLAQGGSVAAGTLTTAGNVDTKESGFSIEQGGVIDLAGTNQSKLSVYLNGGTVQNGSAAYITTQDISDGTISSVTGATRVELGAGTTFFTGNTYTGTTLIEDGTFSPVARATAENAFSAASVTTIGRNATLDLGGFDQTVDVFQGGGLGSGTITNSGMSAATLTTGGVNATSFFAGVIQDGDNGGSLSLAKVGTGTLTLSAANTYTGTTTVSGGTLQLDGATAAASAVTVASGATLAGDGTAAGSVTVAGILSAGFGGGASYGSLATGTLTLDGTARFVAQIGGSAAGQYDRIDVTGSVTLGGTLDLSFASGFSAAKGTVLTLIANDGTDAVEGRFAAYAEGATVTANGRTYQISYKGNGDQGAVDNDVTLTALNVAPALTGGEASLPAGSEDTAYTVTKAQLLQGYTDADGDSLSIIGLTADFGAVRDNGDGTYTITPQANYNGPVGLTYGVTDGTASVQATQSFDLAAVNDPPVATGDAAAVLQRTSVTGNVITDPPADSDPDAGDTLAIATIAFAGTTKAVGASEAIIDGQHGTLSIERDGSYSYDADVEGGVTVGDTVTDTFTYSLDDSQGGTDTADLTVTVTGSGIGNAGANLFLLTGTGTKATGGAGDDTYVVDGTNDRPVEATNGGTDTLIASVSYTLAAGTAVETLRLTADAGAARLTGNGFANTLLGNAGDNFLDGGRGADFMRGGVGDDTYVVDNAGDRVIESRDGGADRVLSSVSYTLTANVEKLELTGSGNIAGTGNAAVNALFGNGGNNTIDGGLGSDYLTGGAGRDTFVFSTKLGAANVDRIIDFNVVNDTLALENAVFKELTRTGTLGVSAFKDVTDGAGLDADDRILYDHDTGRVSYDADGSGARKAVTFAVLDNHPSLTFQDFQVV